MHRKSLFTFLTLLIALALLVSACAPKQDQTASTTTIDENVPAEIKDYRESVAQLESVTLAEAKSKQESGDEFYLYIGGETCEYCVAFVKEFTPVIEKHDLSVVYLDYYANANDKDLDSFIDEHGLETIPSVLHATKDGFELIKVQSPYSQRRIEAWLGLNQ